MRSGHKCVHYGPALLDDFLVLASKLVVFNDPIPPGWQVDRTRTKVQTTTAEIEMFREPLPCSLSHHETALVQDVDVALVVYDIFNFAPWQVDRTTVVISENFARGPCG